MLGDLKEFDVQFFSRKLKVNNVSVFILSNGRKLLQDIKMIVVKSFLTHVNIVNDYIDT